MKAVAATMVAMAAAVTGSSELLGADATVQRRDYGARAHRPMFPASCDLTNFSADEESRWPINLVVPPVAKYNGRGFCAWSDRPVWARGPPCGVCTLRLAGLHMSARALPRGRRVIERCVCNSGVPGEGRARGVRSQAYRGSCEVRIRGTPLRT